MGEIPVQCLHARCAPLTVCDSRRGNPPASRLPDGARYDGSVADDAGRLCGGLLRRPASVISKVTTSGAGIWSSERCRGRFLSRDQSDGRSSHRGESQHPPARIPAATLFSSIRVSGASKSAASKDYEISDKR